MPQNTTLIYPVEPGRPWVICRPSSEWSLILSNRIQRCSAAPADAGDSSDRRIREVRELTGIKAVLYRWMYLNFMHGITPILQFYQISPWFHIIFTQAIFTVFVKVEDWKCHVNKFEVYIWLFLFIFELTEERLKIILRELCILQWVSDKKKITVESLSL